MIESCFNHKHKNLLVCMLLMLLALNLAQTVYTLLFSPNILFDDVEHLRAAYFVSGGEVPYRDFFEHHHPLLWYLLAPLVSALPHDTIFAVRSGRFISFFISLITGYYIYKTQKKFIGGKICALIGLNMFFWSGSYIASHAMFCIKPDIYQRCCFFTGLYYLLEYFRYKKLCNLQICALFFTFAFLFLQTTLFMLAPLVVPVGYFIYKNPQKIKDFMFVAILPLMILGGAVFWLWQQQTLQQYFETNWLLNAEFSKNWHSIIDPQHLILLGDLLLFALAALIFYAHKHKFNIYIATFATLFLFELAERIFFVTPFLHYFALLAIYAAIVAAPLVSKIITKQKIWRMFFFIICALHLINNILEIRKKEFAILAEYLPQTNGETIFSDFYKNRHGYYWMYPTPEAFDDMMFQRGKGYNINQVLTQSKPQVIFTLICQRLETKILKTLENDEDKAKIIRRHIIDETVLKDYEKTEHEGFYIRKKDAP